MSLSAAVDILPLHHVLYPSWYFSHFLEGKLLHSGLWGMITWTFHCTVEETWTDQESLISSSGSTGGILSNSPPLPASVSFFVVCEVFLSNFVSRFLISFWKFNLVSPPPLSYQWIKWECLRNGAFWLETCSGQ